MFITSVVDGPEYLWKVILTHLSNLFFVGQGMGSGMFITNKLADGPEYLWKGYKIRIYQSFL